MNEAKEVLTRLLSSLYKEYSLGAVLYFTDEEAECISDFLIKNGVNITKEAHQKYVAEHIITDIEKIAYKNGEGDLFIEKAEFQKVQKKYIGE